MEGLTPQHVTVMFLALGVLLGVARLLGEIARHFHQPAILGELVAGILLGPTVLGTVAPDVMRFLFPAEGPNAIALSAVTTLAIVLFLLVAGMEVDLSTIWRQGRLGLKISLGSIVVPFLMGFAAAYQFPRWLGHEGNAGVFTFALFFATALSISALPVIARTLMDIGLYRTDLGMVVVSAAVFNDLVGWIIFAVILGMMDGGQAHPVGLTIAFTLLFAVGMLTVGRWLIDRALPIIQAHTQWPAGVLGFSLTLALLGAAFTEWIGIHAIFGAFLVGVAIGDSAHLRERTRVAIEHFISFIFAPLFFASIGLRVNFLQDFNAPLVLAVVLIACVCKLLGGYAGARWGRMSSREAWAVGFAINSRGAMEIILGLLALEVGIIGNELFVALVIMALVTSMMSGPAMRLILQRDHKRRLYDALAANLFIPALRSETRRDVIRELSAAAGEHTGIDPSAIDAAVWAREEVLSTGIGNGVALPHARMEDLQAPLIVVGRSQRGVDFDAPDWTPAKLIFLMLTPARDSEAQLNLSAEIARLLSDPARVERALQTRDYAEFLALLKSESAQPQLA